MQSHSKNFKVLGIWLRTGGILSNKSSENCPSQKTISLNGGILSMNSSAACEWQEDAGEW
jgi:hypothetical protein